MSALLDFHVCLYLSVYKGHAHHPDTVRYDSHEPARSVSQSLPCASVLVSVHCIHTALLFDLLGKEMETVCITRSQVWRFQVCATRLDSLFRYRHLFLKLPTCFCYIHKFWCAFIITCLRFNKKKIWFFRGMPFLHIYEFSGLSSVSDFWFHVVEVEGAWRELHHKCSGRKST